MQSHPLQDMERLEATQTDFLHEEIEALVPVVERVLTGILSFDNSQFRSHVAWIYPLLCNLVTCRNGQVRRLLSQIFSGPVGSLLPIGSGLTETAEAKVGLS